MSRDEILEELRTLGHVIHALAKNFENGESTENTKDGLSYAIDELQELLRKIP